MAGRPPKNLKPRTFVERVGAGLRRRRERLKLSVEDAAAAAGVSAPAWYHFESGKDLRLAHLPAVAKALRCKVRTLIPEE